MIINLRAVSFVWRFKRSGFSSPSCNSRGLNLTRKWNVYFGVFHRTWSHQTNNLKNPSYFPHLAIIDPLVLSDQQQYDTIAGQRGFTDIVVVPPFDAEDGTDSRTSKNQRWLLWVNRRCSLLGLTTVTCTRPMDPPPGRRKSLDLLPPPSTREGSGVGEDIERAEKPFPRLQHKDTRGRDPHDSIQVRGTSPEKLPRVRETLQIESQMKPCYTVEKGSHDSRALANGVKAYQDRSTCDEPSEIDDTGGGSRILLDNIGSPTRIAAVNNKDLKGIFVIDEIHHEPSTRTKRETEARSKAGAVSGVSCPPEPRGRLSFFPWGAREAMTLAEGLCKPVALSVTKDLDLFIVECSHEEAIDGPRDRVHELRKRQYRVCFWDGSCVSEFLASHEQHNISSVDGKTHSSVEDASGTGKNKLSRDTHGSHGAAFDDAMASEASERSSETEWEACGYSSDETTRLPSAGTRRCLLDPTEMFPLQPPGAEGQPPEVPVAICVLPDDTVVIAFCRLAPLHSGPTVSRAQGVVRAFPRTQHKLKPSAESRVAAAHSFYRPRIYDPGDCFLVRDGLPVITDIAANARGSVFVALCGAEHTGAVIAVGSLAIASTPCASRGRDSWDMRGARTEREMLAVRSMPCRRGSPSDGVTNGAGSFVPIVSGFATALSVDDTDNV